MRHEKRYELLTVCSERVSRQPPLVTCIGRHIGKFYFRLYFDVSRFKFAVQLKCFGIGTVTEIMESESNMEIGNHVSCFSVLRLFFRVGFPLN